MATYADLNRRHIEQYKAWVAAKAARYTGTPLNRAGRRAIRARRSGSVISTHAPISAAVRPQPMQSPVPGSMRQIETQGVEVISIVSQV